MAESLPLWKKSQLKVMLTCPVCQDIFKDPHQLPCGHSYCMVCLEGMIGVSSDMPFRCPDCRAEHGPIIAVQKSYSLSNIADDYRETQKSKQTERVFCDCCSTKKEPAVKSCLKCEVSLCRAHLLPHLESAAFSGHPLTTPLGDLTKRRCPQHEDEVLRYYCSASKTYVCNICALEKNQKEQAAENSTALKRKLTEYMDQRFGQLERTLRECKDSVKTLKEEFRRELTTHSKDSWINCVTVMLLCLWFISVYYAYSSSVDNQILTDKLEKQQIQLHNIYSTVAEVLVDDSSHSERDKVVKKDLHVLTLNIDSASPFLKVSPDLKSVERVKTKLSHPSHPARFEAVPQVLSTECYSAGRHVWEVELEGYWDVAVSYASIRRKGKDGTAFGVNAKSWSLMHNDKGQLFAYHNNNKKVLGKVLKHNAVAVVVDFEKDTVSFFEVDGATVNQLHEFSAELSEPVCLGLGLYRVDPPSRASIIAAQ